MTFLPNGFLIGKHCNILAWDPIIELNNFSDMTYDPVAELWLHLSERAAALLNKEWCQSRRIHPHEWSDTNKVLIVDVSEAMHIVDGCGGYRCQASWGLSSERQADFSSNKRKHRWTSSMRFSSAWTALCFLLINEASKECTGTPKYLILLLT